MSCESEEGAERGGCLMFVLLVVPRVEDMVASLGNGHPPACFPLGNV